MQDQRLGERGLPIGVDPARSAHGKVQRGRPLRQGLPSHQELELVAGVHAQGLRSRLVDVHLIGAELAQRHRVAPDRRQWPEGRGIAGRHAEQRTVGRPAAAGTLVGGAIREGRGLHDGSDHTGDAGEAVAQAVCRVRREKWSPGHLQVGCRAARHHCLAGDGFVDGA